MRRKTLLSLLFLVFAVDIAGCGGSHHQHLHPSPLPHYHRRHRLLRRSQPPDRANQPVLGDRPGNRQLQFQRDLVRSLRNSLKLRPLHRSLHCARSRFG